jgi:hypothetical protein
MVYEIGDEHLERDRIPKDWENIYKIDALGNFLER